MYKHTYIIGATALAVAILIIGILGNKYFTRIAYARDINFSGGGPGILCNY